jgi:xanthine dehydrogenase molybdopterin-binding subunit B
MTDGRKQASGLEAADVGFELRPKNIGARVKRVEDPRLLTGQGAFTADRLVPGAMHVAFRRSDHAHALISSIRTSAAAEMPGVFAIYTAQELDDLVEPVRASSRMENYHATTLHPLARDKVRYVVSLLWPFWPRTATSRKTRAIGSRSPSNRLKP